MRNIGIKLSKVNSYSLNARTRSSPSKARTYSYSSNLILSIKAIRGTTKYYSL